MKKILIQIFLSFAFCNLVYAAPTSSLSITPTATDGTTITASDENTRNNSVTTWANAHDHDDIDTTANTLNVGDAAAGNKTIQANNADSNKPYIRYDDTNNRWVSANDGSTAQNIVVQTGSTLSHFILPQSPSRGDMMWNNGTAWDTLRGSTNGDAVIWDGDRPRYGDPAAAVSIGQFSRDMSLAGSTQSVTGLSFRPSVLIFFADVNSESMASWGVDDGSSKFSIRDQHNITADEWTDTTSFSISIQVSSAAQYDGRVSNLYGGGFDIIWTRSGVPTGTVTIYYYAIK